MEKIDWKVEGMTCSSCALTVSKFLQKEGMEDVKVNPLDGAVSFTKKENTELARLKNGIGSLGYKVVDETAAKNEQKPFLSNNKQRFLFTLPFTLVLML